MAWHTPDSLPLVPGWPPSDADLAPVLEDSRHFFYLSELLGSEDLPYVSSVRLAAFNAAEAWIFAFLPALWTDPKRLNKWVLLTLWAVLGVNLTNAFLAPYLMVTELRKPAQERRTKCGTWAGFVGGVNTAVVGFAAFQCATATTPQDWSDFGQLVTEDRTYLAFCVDLVLFSVFQPLILSRVKTLEGLDYVPFVGLIAWLFS
jgi:hypothetical protein